MNVRGGSRKGRLGAGKEDQWFEPVQEKGKLWFQNCKKTTGIPSPFSQRCDDNSRKKKKGIFGKNWMHMVRKEKNEMKFFFLLKFEICKEKFMLRSKRFIYKGSLWPISEKW